MSVCMRGKLLQVETSVSIVMAHHVDWGHAAYDVLMIDGVGIDPVCRSICR